MKYILFKTMLILGWSLFGVFTFFSSLKSQLIINENVKEVSNKISPQGWGFFTKNPRDPILSIYKIKNGELLEIDISNQSLKNSCGFSRSARMIGYEMSKVAEKIRIKDWKQNLNGNMSDHLNDSVISIDSKHQFRHLTKGEYLLKLYSPIPYAWAKFDQEKYNRFSVVKVNIK
ncbi:SdpA family antimicrobial peptide system protein [Flavobacterium sp. WLB]|uniref:SdpA family antimicrobial peptide system protein n=1 Tax=unclassified Flavobacterium TaxID=196869 RepID=UPI0006ABA47E|nr:MULTISPECIES: SdpA family antimicrobial peptide system protein [unclassified Flavobacterium]KOP37674.1 hypothetical protein AKO67_13520 [Flavobacterium sp. VMW]OWU91155.1 hypothetical protein APR43_09385 [Flavobacterium sp. NLM]PUU70165.1 SdpA family antimicrobial peptide system protein [Flavobacterium sp. WLB]